MQRHCYIQWSSLNYAIYVRTSLVLLLHFAFSPFNLAIKSSFHLTTSPLVMCSIYYSTTCTVPVVLYISLFWFTFTYMYLHLNIILYKDLYVYELVHFSKHFQKQIILLWFITTCFLFIVINSLFMKHIEEMYPWL